MITPYARMSIGAGMSEFYERACALVKTIAHLEKTSRPTANLNQDLAERGRFDEEGGELSDEDWDNARAR